VQEYIEEIRAKGYTIVEGFLADDQVLRARNALEKIEATVAFGKENFGGVRTKRASNLVGRTCDFDDIVTDPRLLALVEGVLGPAFQLSISAMIKIFPGESAQPLHQDDGLWPAPRPHQPFVLNTMFAIDPFTEENGGTTVVPGSHLSTDPVDQSAKRTSVTMPVGALLAWDGALWHGGGTNTSDQERLGLNINYNLGWLRQQENQFVSIPPADVLARPPRLQRLLGYQHHHILGLSGGRDPLEVVAERYGEG
jgi:ectoine hydroxylase-related dioxygenase (phytanoyl-CoA dioxygenase family)